VTLNERGRGSVVFPAEQYPHGPVTVRISGGTGGVQDNCYLQLYNQGGVSWGEGMPGEPPPAAAGMKLVFADDFDRPLSIGDDPQAIYYDHKPPRGSENFSTTITSGFTAARRSGLEPGNLAGRARTGDVFTGGSKRAGEDGLATTRDLAHACA